MFSQAFQNLTRELAAIKRTESLRLAAPQVQSEKTQFPLEILATLSLYEARQAP